MLPDVNAWNYHVQINVSTKKFGSGYSQSIDEDRICHKIIQVTQYSNMIPFFYKHKEQNYCW